MRLSSEQKETALNTWFTPAQPATKNYVSRGHLDKTIQRTFETKGQQILIYGQTGAGKTSMVIDNLNSLYTKYGTDNIRIQISETTTLDSFKADVAQALKLVRNVNQSQTKGVSGKVTASANLISWFSTSLQGTGQTSTTTSTEFYSGNDEFAIIQEVLFKRDTILVIDDMEKLHDETLRTRLAEVAKNMSDNSVSYSESYAKIIFVGIADTANQLIKADSSLESRLDTIEVPYLNIQESSKIIETGWSKAQLISTKSQIKHITYIAAGIGHIVHELGKNVGYAALDNNIDVIEDTFIETSISDVFMKKSVTYSNMLEKAKNKVATKTKMRNIVLYVIANSNDNSLSLNDVLNGVNKITAPVVKANNSVSPVLSQLKGNILVSDSRNSWGFSDPMFKVYVRAHSDELIKK